MDRTELFKALTDPERFPIDVLRGMIENYGLGWFEWPFSVLRNTLVDDMRLLTRAVDADLPDWAVHRALALAALAAQDLFWEHWEHFHFLTQALCSLVPDPQLHRELSVGQMMRSTWTAEQVRKELGHLSHVPEYSEEVARYVAAQALHAGVWYLPPPLDFAEKFAAGRRYRCRDCGNDSEVLFDDGFCDVCTNRFDVSGLGAWRPDPALVAKGWGRHLTFYDRNPGSDVRVKLLEALHKGTALGETGPANVCAARLLAAATYAGYPLRERLSAP